MNDHPISERTNTVVDMALRHSTSEVAARLPRGWAESITADTADAEIEANGSPRHHAAAKLYRDHLVATRELAALVAQAIHSFREQPRLRDALDQLEFTVRHRHTPEGESAMPGALRLARRALGREEL